AIANWILEGDPGLDLWPFDIRRFGPLHAGQRFLHDRAVESYSKYYAIHWPGEELESARGVRRSPLYQILKDQGAVFGSKFGWERANWFARGDIAQQDILGFDRPQQDITIGHEHRAAREAVVLIDMSSFTKFEISGPQACSFLQYLAVANVDKQPGGATYTQLCNERGGIEADVTIIRRSEDCFWLITGSAFGIRDRHWIESQLQGNPGRHNDSRRASDEQWIRLGEQWTRSGGQSIRSKSPKFNQVEIRDITSNYGVINLAGPLARQVLAKVCDDDVSHDGFPFMAARDIRIGYAPALAYRVTYIGELGWELYIPTEYLQYVYEELQAAGEEFGITNIGYRAVDSLRLEKRYLAWGVDITPDYNPYEAGLQFLIDWDKGDFSGAEALARIRQEGVQQKLVCLALNDPLTVFGGEAIFCGDRVVAQTTSGNFGYSTGKSLVLGYLPVDVLDHSDLMVEAFGKQSSASIVKGAIYDPKREKILC
ncbi:MAG: sarcosine dehydrogenase, partial [Proteobacteria bacterium]|nr:sarcosine dehydrogenase [Pseudomonadota bacterium]